LRKTSTKKVLVINEGDAKKFEADIHAVRVTVLNWQEHLISPLAQDFVMYGKIVGSLIKFTQ
jgi:hypothetical protein